MIRTDKEMKQDAPIWRQPASTDPKAEDMQLQVKPTPYRMQRIPIFGSEIHQPRRKM
jgi:hypothetical protein